MGGGGEWKSLGPREEKRAGNVQEMEKSAGTVVFNVRKATEIVKKSGGKFAPPLPHSVRNGRNVEAR